MSETNHHMNCEEMAARLFQYVDRELDAAEQAAVRAHLDRCGPCTRFFRFEENVLIFLGERLGHTRAPDALRDRISAMCLKQRAAH